MRKERVLTQKSFDELLSWLAPEREEAAQNYEIIRQRLINLFHFRGNPDPEALTDETITRVADKASELKSHYKGEIIKYFYGVANNVYRESMAPTKVRLISLEENNKVANLPAPRESDAAQHAENCLESCLAKLSVNDRDLLLHYYSSDKQNKNKFRENLAYQAGLSLVNLRVKIYRLRNLLEKCVKNCLAE